MAPNNNRIELYFVNGAEDIPTDVKIVETRIVLADMDICQPSNYTENCKRHAGIEVELSNGQKLFIDKAYGDSDHTGAMFVTEIDTWSDDYHFRYNTNKHEQIPLKKLLQKCEEQKTSFKESNCQETALDLFNTTTNLKEVDIPQQFLLDVYRLYNKTFGYEGVRIQIVFERTKDVFQTICRFPEVRSVAGIAVSACIINCCRNKRKVLDGDMSISGLISASGKVILTSSLFAARDIVISKLVSWTGKNIYQSIHKAFVTDPKEESGKFFHKATGTMTGALWRPFLKKMFCWLQGEDYDITDAVCDWSLETITQTIVYGIRKCFGVTTKSNHIVNVVCVIMPQMWQMVGQWRKKEKVEFDWWGLITSLITVALSTTAPWWVVWIMAPFVMEMIKEFTTWLFEYFNDDQGKKSI